MDFKLNSPYQPTGDQPQAIAQLVDGVQAGREAQTLLGVTGSGKTFTMANVIQQVQKPTLILSHNKTLAAQREFVTLGRKNNLTNCCIIRFLFVPLCLLVLILRNERKIHNNSQRHLGLHTKVSPH